MSGVVLKIQRLRRGNTKSSGKLATRLLGLAMAAVLLLAATAQAQQHAHLLVQLGHSKPVRSVAFSHNSRYVLTSGNDGAAVLWEAANGREIMRFEDDSEGRFLVSFSPDGRSILTGRTLWDAASGKKIWRFVAKPVLCSGPQCQPAGEDCEVCSPETGPKAKLPPVFISPETALLASAFSPNSRQVLTASVGTVESPGITVRIWNTISGREIREVKLASGPVSNNPSPSGWALAAAFSPDGRYLLTSAALSRGSDSATTLWDVISGKEVRRFEGRSPYHADSVSFSPDGHYVLTGSLDRQAVLWDATSGQEIQRFDVKNGIESLALSPDGRSVLIGSYYKIAQLWDTATGKQLRQFGVDDPADHNSVPPPSGVNPVAFSPDGRYIVTGSADLAARLWDPSSGKELQRFEGQASGVTSAAFSQNEQYLMTVSRDRAARLWDTNSGKQLRRLGKGNEIILSAAFSPDSKTIVTGGGGPSLLWDVNGGDPLLRFDAGSDDVDEVAFSHDGRFVATGGWGKASVSDAKTGLVTRQLEGIKDYLKSVAFSPDDRYVLAGTWGQSVDLWNAESGIQVKRFVGPHHGNATTLSMDVANPVAFSPNGRFVLTGSDDGVARLKDLATGQPPLLLQGHTSALRSVAYSPNGSSVLTGGLDDTARLWDPASGKELKRFEGNSLHDVESVGYSADADGRYVLTGSGDGTTRLWNPKTGKELASIISFENGGWAVVDPEGRFDTDDLDGNAPMQWVVDDDPMRALPLEIFMHDYYTPRLLSRIISGEKLPPIRSIAQITNRVQPDVSVVSVTPSTTHPGRVDVVVRAASHKNEKGTASGLRDLRLFRNGQMVDYRKNDLKDGNFTIKDIQLPTSVKTVTFTAYAFNSMNIKSPTAQKDYAYEPRPAARPHAYLLQIGVNHYQASGCELHGSATDAEELSKVLTDRLTKRGLDVKPVRLISTATENGATKKSIHNALAAIAAVATPDDVFFLSFSGHGYGDKDGRFYIFPSDVEGRCNGVNDAMLRQAISADELTEWLRPIDAGEMTFILDSCQSASSVEANDFKPGPMGSRGLGQLAYDKRMRILTASQSNQEAQERNLPVGNRDGEGRTQGLLSYALTEEGLVEGKADWKPKYGQITVGKWLTYAADAVPKSLATGAVQTPKGMKRFGASTPHAKSAQIPAVFDFSKNDTFVLQ